ncbi:MAG: hypothetical protein KAR40_14125 [Candidatus Sabulitectum sp.]|nr:hypothetical protein [Candidatus Sabulitectum sp.]
MPDELFSSGKEASTGRQMILMSSRVSARAEINFSVRKSLLAESERM